MVPVHRLERPSFLGWALPLNNYFTSYSQKIKEELHLTDRFTQLSFKEINKFYIELWWGNARRFETKGFSNPHTILLNGIGFSGRWFSKLLMMHQEYQVGSVLSFYVLND
jgi:hypothetical protein